MHMPPTLGIASCKFPEAAQSLIAQTVAKFENLQVRLAKENEPHLRTQATLRREGSSWEIVLKTKDTLPHMIFHEVLHLQRFAVQRIPELFMPHASPNNDATALEDSLEHRHIVPTEICHFPNAAAYWRDDLTTALDCLLERPKELKWQRFNLVKAWLVVRSTCMGDLLGRYNEALDQHGFTEFATTLADRLEEFSENKVMQLSCCVSMFEFNRELFRIRVPCGESIRWIEVPEFETQKRYPASSV